LVLVAGCEVVRAIRPNLFVLYPLAALYLWEKVLANIIHATGLFIEFFRHSVHADSCVCHDSRPPDSILGLWAANDQRHVHGVRYASAIQSGEIWRWAAHPEVLGVVRLADIAWFGQTLALAKKFSKPCPEVIVTARGTRTDENTAVYRQYVW
jgi:hypothetical protein